MTKETKIKTEFRRRQKRQLAVIPFFVLALGLLVFSEYRAQTEDLPPDYFGLGILAAVVFAGLLYSAMNWRCPACDKYLGKRLNPRYCSECGAELR